jgi:Fis family transcriptional regulator
MIGRAAQGRPWIFREIAHFLATGQDLAPPLVAEVRRAAGAPGGPLRAVRRVHRRAQRAQAHRLVRAGAARRRGVPRRMNALEDSGASCAVGEYFDGLAAVHGDRMPAVPTNKKPQRRTRSMSKKQIEECVRNSLEGYFRDLRGTEPDGMYEMLVKVVEKPLLEVVMAKADQNQSRAAEWLGLNRNTLRKKLIEHKLLKGEHERTPFRLRQDRAPRLRPRPARAGHPPALHRRHREAAGRPACRSPKWPRSPASPRCWMAA